MAMPHLKPWMVILLVKLIEAFMQTRPKALIRSFFHKDRRLRRAMFWYNNIGKRVWFYELFQFFFKDKRTTQAMPLKEYWQPLAPQALHDQREAIAGRKSESNTGERAPSSKWLPSKSFKGKKPCTTVPQTAQGRKTLTNYVNLLQGIPGQAE
jgi:hypothetical protein